MPPALERTVRRCLEKTPAERFQSARDVAFALEALSGESGMAAAMEATSAGRRRFLASGAVALPAVAAGVLGYVAGLQRARVQAPPRLSFKRLTFRRGPIVSARFGPDGRTVYYGAAWEGEPFRVYQTRPEGGELPLPIENADLLSVARDGRLAALLVKRSILNAWWKKGTLAVLPAAGGALRELAEDVYGADFAPDGRSLAVVRDGSGQRRLEYPLEHVLYETDGYLSYPRVSPDGERVAFFEFRQVEGVSLAVVDRSGRRSVLVDRWEDWFDLAWSPDGREVWFAAVRPCGGTTGSLHTVDLGGRRRILFEAPASMDIHDLSAEGRALVTQVQNRAGMCRWAAGGDVESELSWRDYSFPIDLTQDGRTLLFNSFSECSGGEQRNAATFVRALDGAPPVRVADGWALALSPDGRFALSVAPRELRLTPIGAGEPRVVGTELSRVVSARWLRDGDTVLLLAMEAQGGFRFHRVDLARGSTSPALPASASFKTGVCGYSDSSADLYLVDGLR